MIRSLLRKLFCNAVNLVAIDVDAHDPDKEIAFGLYWTGTYTLNGTGDNVDFTAVNNPDGSARNPGNLVGSYPLSQPKTWSDNGGDFGNGAYVGIVVGADLKSWKLRFYQANGTELATNAAYPNNTPGTLAASNAILFIGGKVGKF